MAKRVLVLSLGLILVLSLSVYGAKKSTDQRMSQRLEQIEKANYADESIVSRYLTAPEPKIFFPQGCDTAGYTYYDYQHNDVARRQIAWDPVGGIAHLSWMNLVAPEMTSNRFFDYNSGCPWLVAGGMHVTPAVARSGYGGLGLLPDGREVLCYHRTQPETPPTLWGTTISIERTTAGLGEFDAYDIPDSVKASSEKGFWPTMAISKQMRGDTAFMHITHAEGQTSGGVDKGIGYVRCFEDPTREDTVVCQSPGWVSSVILKANTRFTPNKIPYQVAKTRLGGITCATSPVSEKVAIVFLQNYASSQTQNELTYVESTNNGDDWMSAGSMTPIKITSYQGSDIRAYDDLAVVYDMNDRLHIMWTTFPSTNSNDVSLWHWDAISGIRKAGFASAGPSVDPGAWNLLIAKFTLGIYPDSNFLYFNYTKFQEGDISATEFANGDIHVKGSTNGGLTWGPEINMTNTNTNACTTGVCLSEHWSSLAEVVDDTLRIQYIEDKDAGGIPQDEGAFTYNPVRYFKYPRPSVPAVASMTFSPSQMIKPVNWATNGGSTAKTMDFDNVGTATLYVQISDPAPGSYLTIAPNSFNIVEAGPTQTVNVTFNGAGLQDTFIIDSLLVVSNDGVLGGAQVYSDTHWVRYHFVVTTKYYYAEFDTCPYSPVTTVSNIGNLGNQEVPENGMFYNGNSYLFEFTPVFVTEDINGSGPVGFTWLHDHHDFLAEGSLGSEAFPNLAVKVFYDTLAPIFPPRRSDHNLYHGWWGYWTKYSKIIQLHPQIILVENWWKWNAPPVWWDDVAGPTDPQPGYFGIAADWDVTSDVSSENKGGYDEAEKLIWVNVPAECTTGFENFYGAFLWVAASVDGTPETGPLGAHVLSNPTQLYPFGGYNDDSLWKYMSLPGYSIESDSCEDKNIVMSFAYVPAPTPSTQIYMKYALLVTDIGETALFKGSSIQAKSLRDVAKLAKNPKGGDANQDGSVSVSDVVYLINFLFKGGTPPWKAVSDVNCDNSISVSDVVYLINFLFKGGTPPCLLWD